MPTPADEVQSLAIADVVAHGIVRTHDPRGSQCFARTAAQIGTARSSLQTLVVRSLRGVLRGVYAHPTTAVHLSLIEGSAVIGLHDLRPASATYGRSATLELAEDQPYAAVFFPAGVAYALWFRADAIHVLASDRAFDVVDEFACRWDDPGLGFRWTPVDPVLSARDALAGSLNRLRTSVAAALA